MDDSTSPDVGRRDRARAERERAARERLVELGPGRLEPRPWQPHPVPPSAIDLIHAFLWWSSQHPTADAGDRDNAADPPKQRDLAADPRQRDGAVAALELLSAARAELDQLETSLLFTGRALDLTWAQMAQAMGLNSPQACQQRLDRLQTRTRP